MSSYSGLQLMFKRIFWGICIALATAAAVSAQAPAETPEPDSGIYRIAPGFLPDPYIVTVRGGDNISTEIEGCAGFIAERPDATFIYEAPSSGFRVFFISDQDATLVLQRPDGSYVCNDDSVGHDPAVEIIPGDAGTYLVWVGSYSEAVKPTGYLMLTEVYTTVAGHILSPIANFVISYIPMEEFIGSTGEQEAAGE